MGTEQRDEIVLCKDCKHCGRIINGPGKRDSYICRSEHLDLITGDPGWYTGCQGERSERSSDNGKWGCAKEGHFFRRGEGTRITSEELELIRKSEKGLFGGG